MLELKPFQTTLHRACRAQPNFLWLEANRPATPFLGAQPNFFVATKEPLQLPLGGSKFSCPTKYLVVKTASRVTLLEQGQKQMKQTRDAAIEASSK